MLDALVNGSRVRDQRHGVDLEERGLAYGDGVFETMSLRDGAIRFVADHLARLRLGCERLGIATPSAAILEGDLQTICVGRRTGIVKLIVTRGAGGRGYRATDTPATRIVLLYEGMDTSVGAAISIRWCDTRLSRNPQLAGIKHLNRLEHVLAQSEWRDPAIAEGLMADTEGEVVCATASNLFLVIDGVLATPDLRYAGVRGVMRKQVLATAQQLGIEIGERVIRPEDIASASELFLTNAVRGVRPVISLESRRWEIGPITRQLLRALESVR